MKHFLKKSVPIVIVLLISGLVFLGYSYVARNLKSFISGFTEENFGSQISISRISLRLPLCLELKNVKLGNSVDISSVRIYPSPASFLAGNRFIVSKVKIIDPVVRIKNGGSILKQKERRIFSKNLAATFFFSTIDIQNGTLVYERGKEDMLEFVRIKGTLESPGIYFSKGSNIRFVAKGFLKNKDSDFLSPLRISGHVEPDNVAKARLQASDIKLDTLGSIYTRYLSRRIKDGRVNLESDIQISKNNLIAECSLEGEDIVVKETTEQEINAPFVANFILLINFKGNLVKIKRLHGNFLKLILDLS